MLKSSSLIYAGRALALALSTGAAAPIGMAATSLLSIACFAQSTDTATKLVAALGLDAHYAERVDAVIDETSKLPVWQRECRYGRTAPEAFARKTSRHEAAGS